jgi:copper resistance protein B
MVVQEPSATSMTHDMGPMQGGSPPRGARDPDYSDGVRTGPTHGIGMTMEDDPRFARLRVDRLEAFHARRGNGQQWEIEGGYGNNRDKVWLRTEGERSRGRLESADAELLWQHAVAAFWDTQLGVRTDTGMGADRQWAAFGIQGLAPYWFELEATGYVGPAGRTAARLRVDYELLFTQRLVLQPELEVNAYGKADPARGLGSGLSDTSLALRLRYEIQREVAPYIGWVWTRRFGRTADPGEGAFEWRWLAGVRVQL